jgi:hypothetical protein
MPKINQDLLDRLAGGRGSKARVYALIQTISAKNTVPRFVSSSRAVNTLVTEPISNTLSPFTGGVPAKLAVDYHAAPLRLDDADRHSKAVPPPLNPFDQDPVGGGVWWHWRLRLERISGIFDHQGPRRRGRHTAERKHPLM